MVAPDSRVIVPPVEIIEYPFSVISVLLEIVRVTPDGTVIILVIVWYPDQVSSHGSGPYDVLVVE